MKIDGERKLNANNPIPREFNNIQVNASNDHDQSADAQIRNFNIFGSRNLGPSETVVGSTAIAVEKENLLTTLSSIGPSFEISLLVKINSWKPGYANIIHLTEGGPCCNVGERIPAVFTYNNKGRKTLYVSSAIGNNWNYGVPGNWYIPEIPTNSWFKLVISQFEKEVKF